ncbi:hypothetical protein SEA_SQUIDDLY_95 [Gordonia phage Squiddly]|nr:hypothetical protein SEA_SQUIDDLY_95 [Gordonia phage Squiddly]
MPELDLAAIANRWSTYGGMGNPRSADDYTDAGCRIFAEHGFRDVPALVSRVRELEAREKRVREVVDRVDGVADEVAAVAAQDPVGTAIVEAYRTITTQIRAELEDPS